MREVKVAKYCRQWCETRMIISAIVSLVSFCIFVLTTPIMAHFYDEYGLHSTKTIVSIIVVSTFFVVWLYCYAKALQFENHEEYIYNRIKKIKRKQDKKYRKWLM